MNMRMKKNEMKMYVLRCVFMLISLFYFYFYFCQHKRITNSRIVRAYACIHIGELERARSLTYARV